MARFEIDETARADLDAIYDYIADQHDNPAAADGLMREFRRKAESYAHQPEMGDLRDDLGEGLRSFTFKRSYVVIYRPLPNGIDVLRVFHGARDYGKQFQ